MAKCKCIPISVKTVEQKMCKVTAEFLEPVYINAFTSFNKPQFFDEFYFLIRNPKMEDSYSQILEEVSSPILNL